MGSNKRLTEGSISGALVKLALPIMATSFVEMAYSMTDMAWLGRVGTSAVAASGTAGFFSWIGAALFLIPKTAVQIGVAQSYGRDDMESARNYVFHTIQLDIIIALIYSLLLILFRHKLIGFFGLDDDAVIQMATEYLVIISIGMIFFFLNPVFSGIFNGSGNSTAPFIINTIGLVINMVLDPMMILGLGPFPKMGIKGAGLATIIAQFIVTMVFIKVIRDKLELFNGLNLFKKPDTKYLKRIFKLGFPSSLQEGCFAFIAMIIAKILAKWGPKAIAVQNVGSQIEAISWMTAGGFATALSSFVGQNYGAEKWDRIRKGYIKAMGLVSIIGILNTCLLMFGGKSIFKLFIPNDSEALKMGTTYLRILGTSQLFMCIEITTAGAFNGFGKTIPPSIVGIVFNVLRIPGSLILSTKTSLGLNGVWWSISMSSVFKGIVLLVWFIIFIRKIPKIKEGYNKVNSRTF